MPQGSNISLNGNMINLISTMLPSFPAADETGVSAGNPARHPLPADLRFGLRMRVRQHGSATESDGGTCAVVAVDNTLYANVNTIPSGTAASHRRNTRSPWSISRSCRRRAAPTSPIR